MSEEAFVSSEFNDSLLSKVSEWNPFGKLHYFQETQRTPEVSETGPKLSELPEELGRAKEERSLDIEEIAKLKRTDGKSMQGMDQTRSIELQAEKAIASEKKMLESMVHQTRQLEQTKISLEEAKLEVRNLQDNIKMLENSTGISRRSSDNRESLEPVVSHEEMRQLRNDLRLALEVEGKSRKAMDDFAVALKEVTTEANQTNAELAKIQSELEKIREDARCDNSLLKRTEQKLLEALDVYNRLKLEYEEYAAAWMEKEEHLVDCVRISEEHLAKEKQENSRMNNALKAAREENAKLREIIKQALSEATTVKEALENARNENSQLKNQLFEKESVLQQTRQDYDSLKVSEAAALDCVREMKSLLASNSTTDSNRTSKYSEIRSLQLSKSPYHGEKMNKCLRIFPSDKWKTGNISVNGSRRRFIEDSGRFKGYSIGESGRLKSSYAKEGSRTSCSTVSDIQVPLIKVDRGNINLEPDELDGGKKSRKKKKTVLDRLAGSLRRRSTGN